MNKKVILIFCVLAISAIFLFGCTGLGGSTFKDNGKEICRIEGKPVVRLYSTTWCPHCEWIRPTFDRVAKEYMDANKIMAYHWQLDTKDDSLTPEVEGTIPEAEVALFQQTNSEGSIPVFLIGCKYYRIGNGFEQKQDLNLEETELRRVFEEALK
ncbi:MAG: thioredoxin family protein [archaeon]